MRHISARPVANLKIPVEWRLRANSKATYYQVTDHGPAVGVGGLRVRVVEMRPQGVVDLADPTHDVMALVGLILRSPEWPDASDYEEWVELFYWRDKFWVMACDSTGVPYYQRKRSALYEIEFADGDQLLSQIKPS
jgi:hypothetical protein